MTLEINKIHNMDCLEGMKQLDSESIDMVMTSPPYWSLRDYGSEVETVWDGDKDCKHKWNLTVVPPKHSDKGDVKSGLAGTKTQEHTQRTETKYAFCSKCSAWKGQLGLEPTFDLYITHLCDIFDDIKRVLKKEGTCWVNLGDTYSSGNREESAIHNLNKQGVKKPPDRMGCGLPDKSLVMIPFRFAIEMVNRGWILRNTIIWHKRNCMPSSAKDRFTVDFEYLFFFTKSKKYYFERQYEDYQSKPEGLRNRNIEPSNAGYPNGDRFSKGERDWYSVGGRNKRTVWTINPKPFPEAHFAVYPEELCETPIKAGCPEFVCEKCGKAREIIYDSEAPKNGYDGTRNVGGRTDGYTTQLGKNISSIKSNFRLTKCKCDVKFHPGIVLDPFLGAGTTAVVAKKLGRNYIGFELKKEYIEIGQKRINKVPCKLWEFNNKDDYSYLDDYENQNEPPDGRTR